MKITTQILFGTILVSSLSSFAEEAKQVAQVSANLKDLQQQTSVTQVSPEAAAEAKKFSLATSIEYSQKNAVDAVGDPERSTGVSIIPGYKLNETFKVSGRIDITKDLYGPENTTTSDVTLKLGIAGIKINEQLKSSHSVSTVIPASEASKKVARLQSSIGISNGLSYENSILSIAYSLSLSRNFHEYNFNAEGSANVEYRLGNSVEIKIPITDKFSISTLGIYKIGRTYGGFERFSFESHSDLNYDFTDMLSMNLGTSNGGSALKANGVDSNIDIYNENTSETRLGLSYTY